MQNYTAMNFNKRLSELERQIKPGEPDVDFSVLTDDELAFFEDVLERTNGTDFHEKLTFKEFFTFKELWNKCHEPG